MHSTATASYAIEALLERGAQELYQRYIISKLPQHTGRSTVSGLRSAIRNVAWQPPKKELIPSTDKQSITRTGTDNYSPNSIGKPFKEQEIKSNREQSTKYETIMSHQSSKKRSLSRNIQLEYMVNEQCLPAARQVRPFTAHSKHQSARQQSPGIGSSHSQVKTTRVDHSKSFKMPAAIDPSEKSVFTDNGPPHQQQKSLENELRQVKLGKMMQQLKKRQDNANVETHNQKRRAATARQFRDKRQQLVPDKVNPEKAVITNFEAIDGSVTLNGKLPPKRQHNIVTIAFSSLPENIAYMLQAKTCIVKGIRQSSIIHHQKKTLFNNREFNNNHLRQVSSVPFVDLSTGVIFREKGIEVQASRQRAKAHVTRSQFTSQGSTQKFKSYLFGANSKALMSNKLAQGSAVSCIAEQMSVSHCFQQSNTDMFQDRVFIKSYMQRPDKIRVTNKQIMAKQILQQ